MSRSTLLTVAVAGFRCNCCPDFSNAASAASKLQSKTCGNSAHVCVKEFPTRESYESWVSDNTMGSEWLDKLVLSGAVPCTVVSVNGEWGSCSEFLLLLQTLFPDVKVKRVSSFTQKVAERLIDDISDLDDVNDSEHELISKCPRLQMLAATNSSPSRERRSVRRYRICDDLDFAPCAPRKILAVRRATTLSTPVHRSTSQATQQPSHTHLRSTVRN